MEAHEIDKEVERRVLVLIGDCLGLSSEEIKLTHTFVEDLNADSLDLVDLIMATEEDFEIDIPDEEAEKVKTVQDAVTLVRSKVK